MASAPPESPSQKFKPQLLRLCAAVSPSVVALLSYFSGSKNQEIPHSARRGTGVFVEPKLIVTSARVVGRVSTVYDSERGTTLHNCFLARTIAFTMKEKVLCTTPVAVCFGRDIAVLKVVTPWYERRHLPPPCAVAEVTASGDKPLLGIARHENCSVLTTFLRGVGEMGKESGRPKAPWPMEDELEWVDYGATEHKNNVIASLVDSCGSPWFNLQKEVVGVASWAAEAGDGRIKSYAVPPYCIRSIVNYAKTKGPKDPIVLDRWIDNVYTAPQPTSEIVQECVPRWTRNIVFNMYV